MEVLSRKTYIETGKSVPRIFMTAKQLSEYEGMTLSHYYHIFGEIKQEISDGRYPKTVMGGNPMSVNFYAYRDYITNRRELRDKKLRKRVKPFDAAEIAQMCPIIKEVIVMGEEE